MQSFSLPPVLNPKTYRSRSGEYTLFVDPSNPKGHGKAAYAFRHKGKLVWEGERPFTLSDARVSDDGLVGGYAYSHGLHGVSAQDCGTFEVVLLDATGAYRVHETVPRNYGHYLDAGYPNPNATGLFVDPDHDRFVVRIFDENINRAAEVWWTYSLATGKPGERLTPKQQMPPKGTALLIVDAQPIAGTPLTLLHWWRVESTGSLTPSKLGGTFTLVDLQGKPVWRLDLPTDYNIKGTEQARWEFRREIRTMGAILECQQRAQFTLRHVATKQRVTYSVVNTNERWQVRESKRAPYRHPPAASPRR